MFADLITGVIDRIVFGHQLRLVLANSLLLLLQGESVGVDDVKHLPVSRMLDEILTPDVGRRIQVSHGLLVYVHWSF